MEPSYMFEWSELHLQVVYEATCVDKDANHLCRVLAQYMASAPNFSIRCELISQTRHVCIHAGNLLSWPSMLLACQFSGRALRE